MRRTEMSPEEQPTVWEQHNLEQLRYFQSLTLRQKLQAVEGMCDVARRLAEMRDAGELK